MEKSLKQIIYETNVLVNAHVQLRSFYYGDLLDIIKIGRIDYASCFLSINSASNNANFETFNLELFVFDILASDDSNRTDIENTTKRILNDLITTIRYSNRWNDFSEVLNDVSELKYYDKLQDRLSGWGATIQLKVYSNDCLVGLPIDDYDFDMGGNFEATVLAIVKNTDNDILATKLVSDSDDIIIVPNITITDSDGTEIDYPSGVNFTCTAGGGSGDVTLNGTNIGQYTAPTTFAASVTLNGTNSGTWNSGTQTWEVVSPTCDDVTVTVNGNAFATVPSGDTLDVEVQDGEGNPYLGVVLASPIIYIPQVPINVNGVQIIEQLQGTYSLDILDRGGNAIGTIEDPNTVRVNNPLKGNFQANVGVLAQYVMTSEDVGTYTTVTNDGASGTVSILINGVALSLPYTAIVGDTVDASRTINTAAGWFKLD
jgi:hypothetical protein